MKTFYFDLKLLTDDKYIVALEKNKEESKKIYQQCVIDNFKKAFDHTSDMKYEDVDFMLQRTKEGRAWYRLFRTEVVFTLETELFAKGLDLSNEEREIIKMHSRAVTEKRRVLVKQVEDIAKKFQEEKSKADKAFFDSIGNANPLVVIKFLTADHLSVHELIPIRRIVNATERDKATERALLDMKQRLINEYRSSGTISGFLDYLK